MDSKGWATGAQLMRKWFSREPAETPNYSAADDSTITVDWTLQFPRAKQIFDSMVSDKVWANDAAQEQLRERLKFHLFNDTQAIIHGAKVPFSLLAGTGEERDKRYINQRNVEYGVATEFDDLLASLGAFSYRVVVAGEIQYTPFDLATNSFKAFCTIREVGIYVKDSYDFSGDQLLGFWNDDNNSVSLLPGTGTLVTNQSFRDWRSTNQKGGDFMIHSSNKMIDPVSPHTFLLWET